MPPRDPSAVAQSQAYCLRLTRAARSSFPLAFRLLSRPKRRAMTALYAFYRLTDDIADGPAPVEARRTELIAWRSTLQSSLDSGTDSHPVHAALSDAVARFGIPSEYLFAVLDGVEGDLEPRTFQTLDELKAYCYQVASAVGLACLAIWGVRPGRAFADAVPSAVSAGYAFQFTNILRDLSEDHAQGRVYLPADDLARFGVVPGRWAEPESRTAFLELMRFELGRTQGFYREAGALSEFLTAEGRAIYQAMTSVYAGLAQKIAASPYDVLSGRVRLSPAKKAWALVRAVPVRWGLSPPCLTR